MKSIMTMTLVSLVLLSGLAWAQEKYPPSDKWRRDNEDKKDSTTVAIRCPSSDKCLAPGTCTRRELESMQDKKDDLCNQRRSCAAIKIGPPMDPKNVKASEKVDCAEMSRFIDVGKKCRDQRTVIMSDCFRNGDSSHARERRNVQDVIDDCEDRLKSAKGMKICK